jgi:hypothetical protein
MLDKLDEKMDKILTSDELKELERLQAQMKQQLDDANAE